MNRLLATPAAVILAVACGTVALHAGVTPIAIREDKVIAHAELLGANLADNVLNQNRERFVDYTNPGGDWQTKSDSSWCSGFIPGMFWYLWQLTGDDGWRTDARHWAEGVKSRSTAADNDVGFQILEGLGLGYFFDETLRAEYKPYMLEGADTLVNQRYNTTIGCFRSWPGGENNPFDLPFEVNIDQMMNLELVMWAALNGGPTEYMDYAISHADKSWENNIREDGSSFHVVNYNLDGTVASKRTHQGWQTDSTWSRGQAWAVYGYTLVYQYTGLDRMLERAEKCYDYWITATRTQDERLVPFSDFDAPLDNNNPRDTSATAIVACAAIELYNLTGKTQYLREAEQMLGTLTNPYYLSLFTDYESILMRGSEKWGEPEEGTSFGDFYLLEGLYLYRGIQQSAPVVTGSWLDYDILDGQFVDTATWMGWMSIAGDPYIYSYGIESWLFVDAAAKSQSGGWVYSFR